MDTRPLNILFILTDDQGPWAMGCAGNEEIITPNLDRLAETGLRFDNFFCTSPVCSPARASLLTGTIPSRHGVQDWIKAGNDGEDRTEYLAGMTGYTEILSETGYTCGLSGKWHLGASDTPQKGMAHWYAHQKGSGHYYNPPMYRASRFVEDEGYVSDLITDDAISFMTEQHEADLPFYCGVHFTAPHSPWGPDEHPAEIRDLYRNCPFDSCPQEAYHPHATLRFSAEVARTCLIGYFAAVTAMDRNVGRLLDSLEELGIRRRTLVVFLSDNGFNCGHHGIWGKGNGTTVLNMYDTSVKVPALFSLPGTIRTGLESHALVSGYDFMPTLLELVGLRDRSGNEAGTELPGRSFAHLLQPAAECTAAEHAGVDHAPAEHDATTVGSRDHLVVYDEYGPVRMVRTERFKYVHRYPYGPHELYDLQEDPEERTNRVDDTSLSGRRTELKGLLDEWFLRYADAKRDATHEPVTGNGQIGMSGLHARGRHAFDPAPREVSSDPDYDPGMRKRE